MTVKTIDAYKNDIIHVVIETPQYSSNKYMYDTELKQFRMKKALPRGSEFPLDFGFVPNTLCSDGEPLPVLVLAEGETYPGCLLTAKVIGMLEGTETGMNNKPVHNDRLIAVSIESQLYADITDVKQLNKDILIQIENFFIDYNKHEGIVFKPLRWGGVKTATKKIKDCKE